MAALALTFAACSNDDNAAQPAKAVGIPFTATISIGESATTRTLAEDGTKLKASWAEGEKVALIHNGVNDEMTVSAVNDGNATITGTITGSPSDGDDVTVIYPSTAADGTTGAVKGNLLYAQEGGTLADVAGKYDVRRGAGKLKVGSTASLNGNVSLINQFAIFKFTTKNSDGSATIAVKPLIIVVGAQSFVITPTSATSTLYAALPAVSSKNVCFSATGSDNKTYVYSKDGVTFDEGKFYTSTLQMTEVVAVDLGLSVKWASMNVGATSEGDYGKYYAWGATMDNFSANKSYYWNSTPYFRNGYSWSKYTKSGKTVLDLEDDAARANLGGSWRMPTKAELEELKDTKSRKEYGWDWVTVGGHNGWRITQKSTGANIFLPAAGYRILSQNPNGAGSNGNYLSSTLYPDYDDYSYYLYFSSSIYDVDMSKSYRYEGSTVRAVIPVQVRSAAQATDDDLGKVICSNGHIHTEVSTVFCGGTARAMIAYVGSASNCSHGLAIALEEVPSPYTSSTCTWNEAPSCVSTWANTHSVSGGTWRLPSGDDWMYMFQACGGSSHTTTWTDKMSYSCGDFLTKLKALVSIDYMKNEYYWSSKEYDSNIYAAWSYNFYKSQFEWLSKDNNQCVRAVLVF